MTSRRLGAGLRLLVHLAAVGVAEVVVAVLPRVAGEVAEVVGRLMPEEP